MESRPVEDLREEKRAKVLFLGWEEREAKRNRERRRKKGKPRRIRSAFLSLREKPIAAGAMGRRMGFTVQELRLGFIFLTEFWILAGFAEVCGALLDV